MITVSVNCPCCHGAGHICEADKGTTGTSAALVCPRCVGMGYVMVSYTPPTSAAGGEE